jgi:cell division protein FtsW
MIGLMANAARHEPDAVSALRAGRDDRMNRLLRLPLPEPYLPSRAEALRDRLRTRPGTPKPARAARPGSAARSAAKPAKPAKKAAKPAPKANAAKRSARTGEQPRGRGGNAKAGTAHSASQRSGHHGGASQQRRAAAAQGGERHGNGRARRSRAMEGQRYG